MPRRQQLKELITPFSGIDQSNQSTLIPDGLSPRAQNTLYDYGEIVPKEGVDPFGEGSGTIMPFSSEVQGYASFFKADGSSDLICVTRGAVNLYVSGTNKWIALNPGSTGASLINDDRGDATARKWIAIDDHTAISTDKPVGGATHTDHWVETSYKDPNFMVANSHADSEGWVDTTVYADGNLTGTSSSFLSFTHATHAPSTEDELLAGRYLIINNGIDNIMLFDGTAVFPLRSWDTVGTAYVYRRAKQTIYFNSVLIQIAPVDVATGENSPQQLLWSGIGDILDWDATDSGSTSGLFILDDTAGDLIRAEIIGNNALAVYKSDAIYLLTPTRTRSVFNPVLAVKGTGLISQGAIAVLEDRHIIINKDGFYIYRGGGSVEPAGKNIWRSFIEDLDYDNITRIESVVDREISRIRFYYPSKSDNPLSNANTRAVVYDYGENWWSLEALNNDVTALGSVQSITDNIWSSASGTWASAIGTWAEARSSKGATITLFGDNAGYTYQLSTTTFDDLAGTTRVIIDQQHETKDLTSADILGADYKDRYIFWQGLILDLKGRSIDVDYSTDEGTTWVNIKTAQALTGDYTRYKFDFRTTSRQIRFRFKNDTLDSYFNLRARLGIRYIVRGR